MTQPRLRMFAGPNGSGKSTLKSMLSPRLLGVYLNPDEIEASIREMGGLDVTGFGIETTSNEILGFLGESPFLKSAGLSVTASLLTFRDGFLDFTAVDVNSYHASVITDFLRRKLLEKRMSFSIETVMSSTDKVDLLATASHLGYRTYLYYIATDDPIINISRVQNRVRAGGHDVPVDRIVKRYHRSLDLLLSAIKHTNRTFVFDNSAHNVERTWLVEIIDGKDMHTKSPLLPAWFRRAVLDKLG